MNQFAEWLSTTSLSVFIQTHNSWTIPVVQSLHIVAIGIVIGSALMLSLRILGWSGRDQTLRQTADRFGPWVTGSFWLLLVTGILLVVGEPVRELVTFSFWAKMALVACMAVLAFLFQRGVRRHEQAWEQSVTRGMPVRWVTMLTFLIWTCIIVLGRLIAYDHVWGSWSPSKKA